MADHICPCCQSVTIGGGSTDPCHCDYGNCSRCNVDDEPAARREMSSPPGAEQGVDARG